MATTRNKVMWREGTLMRPHHLQQQQRYNEYVNNLRFRTINDLSWGFTELSLNNELLAQGKIMIDSASGTLPDGTVFSIPGQDALPDPLHPKNFPDEESCNVYLALPVASDVRCEVSYGQQVGRYRLHDEEVRDLHSENGDVRALTLGQLTPRIMSGADDMSAYVTLPLCRIKDRRADGSLMLDDNFIPSCQNIYVSARLREFLKEVQESVGGRANDLANRIGSPAQSGIADVAEFMMLQLLNRNQTRFTHRARRPRLHPEDFYLDLAGLLGELMTFTEPSRLPCPLDVYDHRNLTDTFKTLLPEVKRALHTVLSPRAVIREQLDTAREIREAFFSRQNGLGAQFAVETVSLSGNKRRSVLNLDGQLVDYSQGRNYTAHLVWPNNMREGNESKLTLIGTGSSAPRSIIFSGPWAQFRLFGAGQLTGVQDGTFSVRFNVDGGAMVYRVHTDTEDNPFTGGLFSQFRLSDTLY
ncbi:type VI secretion system baseplate subunit TssK [Salmonella enterica]|nr:type VI secretion system baseplate subunit TssK [Salmonella enterica]EDT4219419.1 type VI secretion system baseplate subunit TssK [Salmonella enterica subsp. salamae]EAZ6402982.1 type VI secretion system baseplate subunit TssK [Salmonella enterica]EBI7703748.1 type VI secretion system baseplate subunit TssK [Salmonella enterica]EBJ0943795.1 type VI secretion system baseplate subunit TssK [Salmonella enterica]